MTDSPALLPGAPAAGGLRAVRCEDCGRPLTDVVSRALGRGERCRRDHYAARRGDVEQDVLPGL